MEKLSLSKAPKAKQNPKFIKPPNSAPNSVQTEQSRKFEEKVDRTLDLMAQDLVSKGKKLQILN